MLVKRWGRQWGMREILEEAARNIIRPGRHGRGDRVGIIGSAELHFLDAHTRKERDYIETQNVVMLTAKGFFLQRLRTLSPSSRTISQITVGVGTTTPTNADTALVSETLAKTITSWDDAGLVLDPPYCKAEVQYDAAEANVEIAEIGLKFDNAALATRLVIAQGTVTGASKANPCVITSVAHGLTSGYRVKLTGIGGMTQLLSSPGPYYYISVLTADTFSLYQDEDLTTPVDSTGYSTFTSGGQWTRIKLKDSGDVLLVQYKLTLN